jgi:hypothetical protein
MRAMPNTPVLIRQVADASGITDWLAVPYTVFAGDPCWVPPLDMVERQRISARHNPFFSFGEAAFFVAYAGGKPVGRISAQVSRRHLAQHNDQTGHFGFFACIDDARVARALVDQARSWLRARGMARMVGPFNLSVNEDIGLLVSGFDSPPAFLAGHSSPWSGPLLEACGLGKTVDLFAYRMDPSAAPKQLDRLAKFARASGRVRLRTFEMTRYAADVALIFDIFNDAWSDNWGFVPFSKAEIAAVVRDTRPIMRGKFGRIVEIDGKPAAMMAVLPDINRVIAPFGGRLLPFNWAKLAAAVWRDRWRTARVPLLGIRKEFRATPLAPAVLALMVSEFLELGRTYNLDWVEFSWVLETNRQMVMLGEMAAGRPSKVYRIYETAL